MDQITAFDWQRIFVGDEPPLFLLEIVFRIAVIWPWTMILLRWIGGRSISQLSLVEFLLVIALGSAPVLAGLLEWATYLEVIRHLIRSYTEQPDAQGIQTARLDRRQYADAWRRILQDEEPDFRKALDQYKFAAMGLGRASVLVAGGIYGEWVRPTPIGRPRMAPPIGFWPR